MEGVAAGEFAHVQVAEVGYTLNGLLEVLDGIDVPGLDQVEALPIIIPPPSDSRS